MSAKLRKIRLMKTFMLYRKAEPYVDELQNRVRIQIIKNYYGQFEVWIVILGTKIVKNQDKKKSSRGR